MSIPSEFMCPISMDLMTDPVIGTDGHTYERAAITEWLLTNTVSPLTRRPMSLSDLQTNFALRTAIERWRLSNEPAPNPLQQLIPDTKTLTVKAIKQGDQAVLDINTTHTQPMETIAIAVLDVSGSMNSPASSSRSSEGANFSRLDLVKHSMKTLATLFNSKQDISLGIITFSNSAKQVLPITKMDQLGLNLALKEIDNLVVEGATNIWDGLRLAFQQADIAMNNNPNANIQILLLTDGEPTASMLPPLGIKNTLTRKLKSLKGKVTIGTFGFGYSLDCELLESISLLGNGSYGFIPDCSMVGIVFINWATRALLTLAHHITVTIRNTTYNVGDLLLGQSQRILVPINDLDTVTVTYDNGQQVDISVHTEEDDIIDDIYLNRFQQILERVKSCKSFRDCPADELKAFKDEISGLPQSEILQAIAKDIESDDDGEGQITKAFSKGNWWDTWGRSHCIAYNQALKLRQCINFKDKVLQHFTSEAFTELQEAGIDIFSNIPAPKPSPIYEGSYYPGQYAPNPSVPISLFNSTSDIRTVNIMSNYVSPIGPCFTGDCKVKMDDNTTKNVENLHKGDKVLGGHKVAAILYTPVQNTVEMVAFESGLKITPWHPMKLTNASPWVFPNDATPDGTKHNMYVEAYYNIILESGHIVELNGYPVVTLGHGFTDNEVIIHPYFGTDLILNDLKRHPGFRTGFIVMNPKNIVRNINSGLVEKI